MTRPEVIKFAIAIEHRLRALEEKDSDWQRRRIGPLSDELLTNARNIDNQSFRVIPDPNEIMLHALDCASYAMMIYDNLNREDYELGI